MREAPSRPVNVDEVEIWRNRAIAAEAHVQEADDLIDAIRSGHVDAVVVGEAGATQVYTLENADRPYRVLIEQMQEGAVTISGDGMVLYCNARFAELVGMEREQVVGASVLDRIIETERRHVAELFARCGQGGTKGETLLFRRGTDSVPVHVSFVELAEADHEGRMLCGIFTDLTEQKAQTAQIKAANLELKRQIEERERVEDALRQAQKMEAIGQLTGGVAHDFNNLLTIIRSSADLLRRHELTDEKRRRYIDAISDTADRAARLTGQLLAFARRQALKPEVFDVNARLSDVTDMLRTVVGSRIAIVLQPALEPCYVLADPSQFETALVNMVVNARDAMNGEGRLDIAVLAESAGDLEQSDFISVAIADSGCGIAQDALGRIFEPFYTSKAVGKGTGLGLSQVYGFAKQSGGEVQVESELGKGARFTICLPRADADTQLIATETDFAPIKDLGKARILVVEDNVDVGDFAASLLTDLGYRTTRANDGAAALALIEADPTQFDVVFSDVIMPIMTGMELAKVLETQYPMLKIVLTSGYSQVLAEEGTQGFKLLQKPYSVESLAKILRSVTHAG